VNNSLQSLLEKGFGQSPGMLKTRMSLGRSLPLQKSDFSVVKLPWGGRDESVPEWISWRSRNKPF
jgi:hypothetical protein